MKIQLFFPKDFKPYLEFNPTLGYIQGNDKFEIWLKFRPDRTILNACQKYLVKQNEDPPKDEFEEFTMRIPIKVTGANQVLPVKFSILCCFSVNAITFKPPLVDFGTVFNQSAAGATIEMENHSLLPQQFCFTRLPKEIQIPTDAGTGTILPGEKYSIVVEYRPTQQLTQDDSVIYCRIITGKICVRELKLPYKANVTKCPLQADKQKIEFPALPEEEFNEVVLSITNSSQKDQMIEIVPPHQRMSGLTINPLVNTLKAGGGALVSLKYSSKFRDLTHQVMEEINNPVILQEGKGIPGLVTTNKKLAERLAAKKKETGEPAAATKGGKAPAAPPKEDPKAKKDAKAPAKGGPTQEEIEEEERRAKEEAEEADRQRIADLEAKFDKKGELKALGGKVTDFDVEDENRRTQHYDWLLPVYYKVQDQANGEINCMYLSVRTTTVKRSLIPNCESLEFGEIPVAFKQTKEILIKNVGIRDEVMRMEALTPFGGFSVLNAMRTIKPGETKPVVVQFEPLAQ